MLASLDKAKHDTENIGCFKKTITNLKEYTNLYKGHTQPFELS
jgi:hypothetical protein